MNNSPRNFRLIFFRALRVRSLFWMLTILLGSALFIAGRASASWTLPHIVAFQTKYAVTNMIPHPGLVNFRDGSLTMKTGQFAIHLFTHNEAVCFMTSIEGLLFFPLLVAATVFRSYLIGVQMYVYGTKEFFLMVMPHGLIEVPVMIWVTAASIQAGVRLFWSPWRAKLAVFREGVLNLTIICVVAAPLLSVAAAMEAFLRPLFQSMFRLGGN